VDYVNLGSTGVQVSRICLGCMSYGDPSRGNHRWALSEEESRPFIRKALESGINFFDTANVYSAGTSEEILGRALREFASRDEVVVASKVSGQMREGPNGAGLSRKAIMAGLDHSLARLGTDYIDLYQFHHPDPLTPIEETLSALDDAVRSGKVRYIGSSNFHAWQVVEADFLARELGVQRFISCQNLYNLLNRDAESDLIPLTAKYGLGFIPFYPLASGLLTGKFRRGKAPEPGTRIAMQPERYRQANFDLIERAESFARSRGMALIDLAFAYLLANDTVPSVIAGASDPEQVKRNVATQAQVISKEDLDEMQEAVWAV
jgi:aryl-alcohol dehydrogenase-like predicted oxidoreductase